MEIKILAGLVQSSDLSPRISWYVEATAEARVETQFGQSEIVIERIQIKDVMAQHVAYGEYGSVQTLFHHDDQMTQKARQSALLWINREFSEGRQDWIQILETRGREQAPAQLAAAERAQRLQKEQIEQSRHEAIAA